jgi:hypothetical protein
MDPAGLMFVALGALALCGVGFDWDWFMITRKSRRFIELYGRGAARMVYAGLGIGLIVLGVLISAGVT